jgi:hypothetical protein
LRTLAYQPSVCSLSVALQAIHRPRVTPWSKTDIRMAFSPFGLMHLVSPLLPKQKQRPSTIAISPEVEALGRVVPQTVWAAAIFSNSAILSSIGGWVSYRR